MTVGNKERIPREVAEKILLRVGGVRFPIAFSRKYPKTSNLVLHIEDDLQLWLFRDKPLNHAQSNITKSSPKYYIVGHMHGDGADIQRYLQAFREKENALKYKK